MYPLREQGQRSRQNAPNAMTIACAPSSGRLDAATSPSATLEVDFTRSDAMSSTSIAHATSCGGGKPAATSDEGSQTGVSRTTTPRGLPSLDLSRVATCSSTATETGANMCRLLATGDVAPQRPVAANAELYCRQPALQQQPAESTQANPDSTVIRRRYRSRSRSHGDRDDWWHDVASQVEAEKRRAVASIGTELPEVSHAHRSPASSAGDPIGGATESPTQRVPSLPVSPQSGDRSKGSAETTAGSRPRSGSMGWMNPFRCRSPLKTQTLPPTSRIDAAIAEKACATDRASIQVEFPPSVASVPPQDLPALVHHLSESISFVREYMGVSGRRPAANLALLQQYKITHIVNASRISVPNFFENQFRYLSLSIQDRDGRFCMEEMMQLFYPVCDFIDSARSAGGRVLVHCHQGVSRSSALVLAYLLIRDNVWPLEEAVRQLLRVRPTACPNSSFLDALSEVELRILVGRYRAAVRDAMLVQTNSSYQALWSSRSAPVPTIAADSRVASPLATEYSTLGSWNGSGTMMTGAPGRNGTQQDTASHVTLSGTRKLQSGIPSSSPMRCVTLFSTSRLSNAFSAWTLGTNAERIPEESIQARPLAPLLRQDEIDELIKSRLFRVERHRATGNSPSHRGMRYLLLLRSFRSTHNAAHDVDTGGKRSFPSMMGPEDSTGKGVPDANLEPRTVGPHAFYTGQLQRRARVSSDRCYVLHTPFSMAFLARLTDSISQRELFQRPATITSEAVHRVRHRRSVSIGTQSMQPDLASHPLATTRPEENEWLGDTRLFVWCGSRAPVDLLYASLRLAWNIAITECLYIETFEEKLAIRDALERELDAALKAQQASNHDGMLILHAMPNQPLHVVFENHEPEEFTAHLHRSRSVFSRWFAFGL